MSQIKTAHELARALLAGPDLPMPAMEFEEILMEPFLFCHADGVVRVKDGRSIEEYVNSAALVARRLPVTGERPEPTPLLMFPLDTVRMLWEYYRRSLLKQVEEERPANMKITPYHEGTLAHLRACGDELKRAIKEAGDGKPVYAIDAARALVNEASKLTRHLHAWDLNNR
jgi:hypothetical protein